MKPCENLTRHSRRTPVSSGNGLMLKQPFKSETEALHRPHQHNYNNLIRTINAIKVGKRLCVWSTRMCLEQGVVWLDSYQILMWTTCQYEVNVRGKVLSNKTRKENKKHQCHGIIVIDMAGKIRVKRSSILKSGKADMLIISNQEQYGIWPQTDTLDLYALFDFPL